MLDNKLSNVLFNGAMVIGGVLVVSHIKNLKHRIKLLKLQSELKDIIIEAQQKIIESTFDSEKEEES